jgi:site-specific recombinase XerD
VKLKKLIEQYIAFRQLLGASFKTNACQLRAFVRAVGLKSDVADVSAKQVNAYLRGNSPLTSTWHIRYNALRGLYRYALSRGLASEIPLPAIVPKRPPPFVPYIYSRDELRRLLKAAIECRHHPLRRAEPVTLRTIVLLLYGAGLRISEAVHLDCPDVDLASNLLKIRDSKFSKSRLVPLGSVLAQALADYATWRRTIHPQSDPQGPFFIGRTGERLNRTTFEVAFRRVCAWAKVHRTAGVRHQPRLHDLRHTFAVHRLTAWYQQGADVQRLLPQLSVYLGHACLSSTQVYLTMTPDLLHQAGRRFEHYALAKDNHD